MTMHIPIIALIARLACGLLVLLAQLPAHAAEPIIIKFSHVVTPDTPKGRGAQKFKELAEKYTSDRVKIEIYPNSQLYKDKEEIEALQIGAVQMLAPSVAKFGPLGAKEFEAFDLPFLFPDTAAFRRVTEGPIGQALFAKLEPKGVIGLAYWDNGFHIMSANKALRVPADFLGLKMRIQSSKVLESQMKTLGATPQVMAFSELYMGLQSGVVDGTEGVASNILTQKIHEVQKFITISNHGHLAYAVIVNKAFWDRLPSDIRLLLETAMAEATAFTNENAARENEIALEAIRATGKSIIIELTADERKAWVTALKAVHTEMKSRVGTDLVKQLYETTGSEAAK
jgi:C4-dicarboxylate-binding protein DctP